MLLPNVLVCFLKTLSEATSGTVMRLKAQGFRRPWWPSSDLAACKLVTVTPSGPVTILIVDQQCYYCRYVKPQPSSDSIVADVPAAKDYSRHD
ncbi:hypothetical protein LY78DRAFT_659109 [Colletotrichum sublineola]|nr:hypothetical protein LY78DRAFT_659109 [Colletotrichum sublineola]